MPSKLHLLQFVYSWRKNIPHFYCRFRSALSTSKSHLLQFVYIRTSQETQARQSWNTLSTVIAKSWKPLILLDFSGVALHVARSVSRSFLALFLLISRIFGEFLNNFRVGSGTIRYNLITYGGILKWLKSPVLKTGRTVQCRRGGSNPSASASALEFRRIRRLL